MNSFTDITKKTAAITLLLFCSSALSAGEDRADAQERTWAKSGELDYSYAYARTYAGYKMRMAKWKCVMGFTSGKNREIEHSVWTKDSKKIQLMLWRIDSGKTGWSYGEIPDEKKVKQ